MNELTEQGIRDVGETPQSSANFSALAEVSAPDIALVSDNASRKSEERLVMLRRQREFLSRRRLIIGIGAVVLLLSPLVGLISKVDYLLKYSWICVLYGLAILGLAVFRGFASIDGEIRDLEYQAQLAGIPANSSEKRAEILFRQEREHLNRYYAQTLTQSRWIFMTGLACIALGFLIIGTTIYYVVNSEIKRELNERILISIVGGVGGVLTNFISVVFLRMYAETIKNLAEFHSRLLGTHYLHFANVMSWKLVEGDHRAAALRSIVDTACKGALLIQGQGHQIAPVNLTGIDSPK